MQSIGSQLQKSDGREPKFLTPGVDSTQLGAEGPVFLALFQHSQLQSHSFC